MLCWDRIGRKMSGLGLPSSDDRAAAGAAGAGGVRKSALFSLIEVKVALPWSWPGWESVGVGGGLVTLASGDHKWARGSTPLVWVATLCFY